MVPVSITIAILIGTYDIHLSNDVNATYANSNSSRGIKRVVKIVVVLYNTTPDSYIYHRVGFSMNHNPGIYLYNMN